MSVALATAGSRAECYDSKWNQQKPLQPRAALLLTWYVCCVKAAACPADLHASAERLAVHTHHTTTTVLTISMLSEAARIESVLSRSRLVA